MSLLTQLGVAVIVFASTNIDDLLILSVFFASAILRKRSIVMGQFLGIGTLVAASAVAAVAALTVPDGWTHLLGVVPLALGLRHLSTALRTRGHEDEDDDDRRLTEERVTDQRTHSQVLAVAGVTIANGGDNLGVYIPLFASASWAIPIYASIFAAMTALWCWIGYRLVGSPFVGDRIRRYGHIALPVVLIALGLHILAGARVLLS
jgi:cadmium resistance protein CadD (predicted permease)